MAFILIETGSHGVAPSLDTIPMLPVTDVVLVSCYSSLRISPVEDV